VRENQPAEGSDPPEKQELELPPLAKQVVARLAVGHHRVHQERREATEPNETNDLRKHGYLLSFVTLDSHKLMASSYDYGQGGQFMGIEGTHVVRERRGNPDRRLAPMRGSGDNFLGKRRHEDDGLAVHEHSRLLVTRVRRLGLERPEKQHDVRKQDKARKTGQKGNGEFVENRHVSLLGFWYLRMLSLDCHKIVKCQVSG